MTNHGKKPYKAKLGAIEESIRQFVFDQKQQYRCTTLRKKECERAREHNRLHRAKGGKRPNYDYSMNRHKNVYHNNNNNNNYYYYYYYSNIICHLFYCCIVVLFRFVSFYFLLIRHDFRFDLFIT